MKACYHTLYLGEEEGSDDATVARMAEYALRQILRCGGIVRLASKKTGTVRTGSVRFY
jgi:hypothetical protein